MSESAGFIGLGLLGAAMAKRLVASGLSVTGFDIDLQKTEVLKGKGWNIANNATEVTRRCQVIHLCVSTSQAVHNVVTGEFGIIAAAPLNGKIVIDHSTTDVTVTRELAEALAQHGAAFIDAPVSGGPPAALAGTLSIMAGGESTWVESVRTHVERLGRFTHMGAVGAGQATKLVNQTLVLPAYCMIAEALRLAQAYDVDTTKVPHALETGHAGSNLLPILFERMRSEDFTPTGYARQVLKDLEMLHSASKSQSVAMPMTDQALSLFRLLVAQGKGEQDGSAIVSLWPKPTGDTDCATPGHIECLLVHRMHSDTTNSRRNVDRHLT